MGQGEMTRADGVAASPITPESPPHRVAIQVQENTGNISLQNLALAALQTAIASLADRLNSLEKRVMALGDWTDGWPSTAHRAAMSALVKEEIRGELAIVRRELNELRKEVDGKLEGVTAGVAEAMRGLREEVHAFVDKQADLHQKVTLQVGLYEVVKLQLEENAAFNAELKPILAQAKAQRPEDDAIRAYVRERIRHDAEVERAAREREQRADARMVKWEDGFARLDGFTSKLQPYVLAIVGLAAASGAKAVGAIPINVFWALLIIMIVVPPLFNMFYGRVGGTPKKRLTAKQKREKADREEKGVL